MSWSRLSARKTRQIARITGLPVIRAWSHGGYRHEFVTQGHLHGWFLIKGGHTGSEFQERWGLYDQAAVQHFDTCPPASPLADPEDILFPNGVPPLTEAERIATTVPGTK